MYTSPPIVRDSPSRLTWADQANSSEFIPKEALDLEEEYGEFSINPDFLLCSDDHSHGDTSNGRSKVEGSGRGSDLALIQSFSSPKKLIPPIVQPRQTPHQLSLIAA
ncbi:hypothetical protein F0562_006037 [Nyssa sinensis]|uniref:Uncharacterized protein n=1 Tax=Nyssa sinensis TaxID=561372 RepID=A0A5J5AMA8_9ASTE|nr:hypothetical protein F0562_006037 [Nyssa sinensis]